MRRFTYSALVTTLSLFHQLSNAAVPSVQTEPTTTNEVSESAGEMPTLPDSTLPTERIRVIGSKDAGLELSSDKILKVPGAGNDPIKAIESFPGVILADGIAPAVRGSSPRDMYYQTDDVPEVMYFIMMATVPFIPILLKVLS